MKIFPHLPANNFIIYSALWYLNIVSTAYLILMFLKRQRSPLMSQPHLSLLFTYVCGSVSNDVIHITFPQSLTLLLHHSLSTIQRRRHAKETNKMSQRSSTLNCRSNVVGVAGWISQWSLLECPPYTHLIDTHTLLRK